MLITIFSCFCFVQPIVKNRTTIILLVLQLSICPNNSPKEEDSYSSLNIINDKEKQIIIIFKKPSCDGFMIY